MEGLKFFRSRASMTQEQLAEQLGVSRAAVGMWETGRSWPSAALLPQIADLLLCTIDELYHPPENYNAEGGGGECPLMEGIYTCDTGALPV